MEKESSEWQLQGQPTVLLTLAHIFHRFAPLLVREHQAGRGRSACARGWDAEVCEVHTFTRQGPRVTRALRSQGCYPVKEEMLPAEGLRGCPRKTIEG